MVWRAARKASYKAGIVGDGLKLLTIILVIIFSIYLINNALTRQVQGQAQATNEWGQLGGGPYRRAALQALAGAFDPGAGVQVKWAYTNAVNAQGGTSFSVNPLLVDLDGDGLLDVLLVSGSGDIIGLRGIDGSVIFRSYVKASPMSTPIASDFDGDGATEVIAVTEDSVVFFDISQNTLTPLWSVKLGAPFISSSPLFNEYTVNNIRYVDVVVVSADSIKCIDISGSTFTVNDVPLPARFAGLYAGASLVGDVNGDRMPEYVAVDLYGYLVLFSCRPPSVVWSLNLTSYGLSGLVLHEPVVGNFDDDPNLEIAVSIGHEVFTITSGRAAKTGVTGMVAVIDPYRRTVDVVQTNQGQLFAWFSKPALAAGDLDADNVDELLIGSGDGNVYLVDYVNGAYSVTKLFQADNYWPGTLGIGAPPISVSVALADVNGDGILEGIAFSTGSTGGGLDYQFYIFDIQGVIYQTSFDPGVYGIQDADAIFTWPSISIGDIDGDGKAEIVLTAFQGVICIDW